MVKLLSNKCLLRSIYHQTYISIYWYSHNNSIDMFIVFFSLQISAPSRHFNLPSKTDVKNIEFRAQRSKLNPNKAGKALGNLLQWRHLLQFRTLCSKLTICLTSVFEGKLKWRLEWSSFLKRNTKLGGFKVLCGTEFRLQRKHAFFGVGENIDIRGIISISASVRSNRYASDIATNDDSSS